jgi:uncharacterized protein YukE
MSGLAMPAGDPAAMEEAAGTLSRYSSQIATLSDSTRSTTGRIATNADWTGSSADAYTQFTGSLATGIGGMESPLRSVPGAVAGYAAALRDAQARVSDYESYTQQANSIAGPVSVQEKAQITTNTQQLQDTAQTALDGLEEAARAAQSELDRIGNLLAEVFGADGPFRDWLETITRPWDSAAADAILEGIITHGETLEEEFEKGTKAAKAAQAAFEAALDSDFKDIVGRTMQDMLKGTAGLDDLKDAVENWKVLAQWTTEAASKGGALSLPEESTLLRMLPALKNLGRGADVLGIIGGTYTVISPPAYDQGGARVGARVAGGAMAVGSAVGLAGSIAAGSGAAWATSAVIGSLTIPGIGEGVAAAAGLYLVGDWAYHNTHAIAHTFDSARHTAAHYADDLVSWM